MIISKLSILKTGAAPLAMALASLSAPAQAQPGSDEPMIIVTGSTIKQNRDQSTLPVTVVTAGDIKPGLIRHRI
ncbi:MAG: hypothetical protein M3N34_06780 [Pseudomonadota bacterium]|nr:hypothetical protein [Pseudomonadota bacterium]